VNKNPLLTQKSVYEAGLSNIGFADDGEPKGDIVRGRLHLVWQFIQHAIQQIASSATTQSGYWHGVIQTKGVEFMLLDSVAKFVEFVDREYDGPVRPAKNVRHVLIDGVDSVPSARNEHNKIRMLDGCHDLRPNFPVQRTLLNVQDSTSIDKQKASPVPIRFSELAVARNSWSLGDYG